MANYAEMLGEQLGTQAASSGLGGIMDLVFQPFRNKQQRDQNEALMKQNIAGQKEMGKFNFDQQMEMWNRTNSEAQMKHLKAAGLNPALMYGGGGGGGSTTTGAGGMGISGAAAQVSSGGNGMNILTPAQVRLMDAQARNLDADTTMKTGVETENVAAKTTLTSAEARLKNLDVQIKEETLYDQINMIVSQTIEQQEKGLQAGAQTTVQQETIQDQITNIKQEAINKIMQKAVMEMGIKVSQAQINKMAADISQRGREIDINEFRAEIEANQPEAGKVLGSMINSVKERIDKIMKFGKDYSKPKQVK